MSVTNTDIAKAVAAVPAMISTFAKCMRSANIATTKDFYH